MPCVHREFACKNNCNEKSTEVEFFFCNDLYFSPLRVTVLE